MNCSLYHSVACAAALCLLCRLHTSASAASPSPKPVVACLVSSHAACSLSSSTPLSLPSPPPPSLPLPHSLLRPLRSRHHRSFPPLPQTNHFAPSALLRPRTSRRRLVQGALLPPIQSIALPLALPGRQRSLPPHTLVTQHTNTLTTYHSPKHTWTRTITLAQLYKQPQAKFPSVPQSDPESHTTQHFPLVCPARYCTRHPTCTSPDSSSSTP